MVQVRMAQENVDRLLILYELIELVEPVSGIEHDVAFLGVDEQACGQSGLGIIPAIGPKESDLHRDRDDIEGPIL